MRVASSFIPQASCLVQGLAVQSLLRQQDETSLLVVGVALEQGFQAHAWVEYNGDIVIGQAETIQYKRLLTLES